MYFKFGQQEKSYSLSLCSFNQNMKFYEKDDKRCNFEDIKTNALGMDLYDYLTKLKVQSIIQCKGCKSF